MAEGPVSPEAGEVGVRTFLIADIRGYTRYTGHFGDEAARELTARFGAIASAVVTGHGGAVVETRGDEVLAVFTSARRALRASIELQRALRAPPDGGRPLPLGVGIGLDAGEAIPLDHGYRGAALNLAARLCSIARPGEVLASDGLVRLAGPVEGVETRARRPVRLKGIHEPVRLANVTSERPLPPLPPSPLPTEPRRRARRPAVIAAVLAVAVVAASVGVFTLWSSEPPGVIDLQGVGVIDSASGDLLGNVAFDGRPAGIAIGLGSVWLTDAEHGAVVNVDPSARRVTDEIPVGNNPAGVSIGDGAVWVVNGDDRSVSRVDPDSGREVARIPVGNGPRDAAFGAGALWVTNTIDATVSKIDPAENRVVKTIPLGQTPSGIAVGIGAAWVTSEATGLLIRIDPDQAEVSESIAVGNGPTGVALGEGAVWVANTPDHTVSRIDPATSSVRKFNAGGSPSALAFATNRLWIGNGLSGTLGSIDPSTRAPAETVDVAGSPFALAASARHLWVAAAPPARAHRGGSLTALFRGGDDFDTIDPAIAYREASWQVLSMVYDGLVTYRRTGGASGGVIVPDLAQSLPPPLDGGRTYSFRVRPGIRYSTGDRVRLEDFRFTFERLFRSQSQVGAFVVAQGLVGSDACFRRPETCDLSKAIVLDESAGTITFHLTAPDPEFLYRLAYPFASVVPVGSTRPDVGTKPLPGTGPYMIDEYRPQHEVRLARNPYFREWSSAAQPQGFPDRITLALGSSPDEQTTLVARNDADIMLDTPPSHRLDEVTTRHPARAHDYVGREGHYLFFNTTIPPFDSADARRAVNFAIDRARTVRLWGHARLAEPTCQVLPPNFPGYRPYCPYTVRPDPAGAWKGPSLGRAKALVRRSGTMGEPVKVWTYGGSQFSARVARTTAGLLSRLGYRTEVKLIPDQQRYFASIGLAKSRAQVGLWGWVADVPAASNFFSLLLSCDANHPNERFNLNASQFCDPSIDRLMRRAQRLQLTEPGLANRLWQTVDRRIVDKAVWAPLINPSGVDFISERVGNYQRNPQFGVLLDQLWVR